MGVPAVAHYLPHGPQRTLQGRIGDELLWPHLSHSSSFLNDAVAMFQEVHQHLEDFWRQVHHLVSTT